MISAPSRPLRLSGNSLLFALLGISMTILSGCNLLTKVETEKETRQDKDELDPIQGRKVFDPETRSYIIVKTAPTEKMDTVRWKDADSKFSPPIRDSDIGYEPRQDAIPGKLDPGTGGTLLPTYNVVFALPFQVDRYSVQGQIPVNSAWALNFYAGARIALEELKSEGASLKVSVLDTRASEAGMTELVQRNADFRNANLIIGPYRRENVRIAAETVKKTGAVLVSPNFAGENLVENNPQVVQINPSLQTHCERLLEYAMKSFRPEQIVLVARGRDVELERLKMFQDIYKRMKARNYSRDTSSLREFVIVDEGDNAETRLNVQPIVEGRDTLAVIIASWSSESFIQNLLRQLDQLNGDFEGITVFGMPQWMEYDRIDLNLYQRLNLHLSTSYFVDSEQWAVTDFRRTYFQQNGQLPSQEAFMGYDLTLYACKMLQKYGTRFQYAVSEVSGQGLHTRFEIKPLAMPGYADREFPPIRQFENRYVNIVRFNDYRFELVD